MMMIAHKLVGRTVAWNDVPHAATAAAVDDNVDAAPLEVLVAAAALEPSFAPEVAAAIGRWSRDEEDPKTRCWKNEAETNSKDNF